MSLNAIAGVLFDLDGTLAVAGRPVPGASGAVQTLRARGLPVAIVTNTTRLSRRDVVERLAGGGLDFSEGEIFTVPVIAASWMAGQGLRRVVPLLARTAWEDLAGLELVVPGDMRVGGRPVDAALIGDPGRELTYDGLNAAFRAVMAGARLIACQRNRYWLEPDGLSMDAGALVAALEYASGATAELLGKPSAPFFHRAVASLGVEPGRVLMVGDDIEGDVRGAQAAGLLGCLVRTGKYRDGDPATPGRAPDLVLDSVAGLPDALGS
jgi:HAD superfamily hydrolase (TIGR01458 family)